MNPVLMIHAYPGANELVKQLWPYYEKSGFDIIGVGTEDGLTQWPEGVKSVEIGRDAYIQDTKNLPERLINTIKYFLSTDYSHVCIIEYDCIFLEPLKFEEHGITCHRAGDGVTGFKSRTFFHVPWFMDRETASHIIVEGERLFNEGIYEKGSPDFFLGLILQNLEITPHQNNTFSANSLDTMNNMGLAKLAYSEGRKFFHGIKSMQQLSELLK